jgi:glucose/arabinose dehydrogenase
MRRRAFLAVIAGTAGCTAPTGGEPADGNTRRLNHTVESWEQYEESWNAPTARPPALRAEAVLTGLEIPWGFAAAPDGDLFVTERTGRVLRVDGEARTALEPSDAIAAGVTDAAPSEKHFTETWFLEGGEGGVLGTAVHPNYPEEPYVYVYYTRNAEDGKRNAVVRFDVTADGADPEPIIEAIPADAVHNGGRLAFGPREYLWVTTGDAGEKERAADPSDLAGSVLRVTPEGDPAPGNPGFADGRLFTVGHRNPQGLSWLPDGTALATEHGTDGMDEVNRLVGGGNYGWPDVRGEEYADTDYRRPLVSTPEGTSWAPSGCVFADDRAPEGCRRRLFVGTLFGQSIRAVTLTPPGSAPPPGGTEFDADWSDDAYTATAHTVLEGVGRVRNVAQGPDGALYALTSNRDGRAQGPFPKARDDRLLRLTPAEDPGGTTENGTNGSVANGTATNGSA